MQRQRVTATAAYACSGRAAPCRQFKPANGPARAPHMQAGAVRVAIAVGVPHEAKVDAAQAHMLFERLRERTLGGPKVLTDSSWRMHLHMGQSGLTKLKEPSAIFEMQLADGEHLLRAQRKPISGENSHFQQQKKEIRPSITPLKTHKFRRRSKSNNPNKYSK